MMSWKVAVEDINDSYTKKRGKCNKIMRLKTFIKEEKEERERVNRQCGREDPINFEG